MPVASIPKTRLEDGLTKYESVKQAGLCFWAEANPDYGGVTSWAVIFQVDGFPASEAWDDWFAYQHDADAMARRLALGEDIRE